MYVVTGKEPDKLEEKGFTKNLAIFNIDFLMKLTLKRNQTLMLRSIQKNKASAMNMIAFKMLNEKKKVLKEMQ